MQKLKDFKKENQLDLLPENEMGLTFGGSSQDWEEASSREVSTDQAGQWETDCGREVTYDSGLVMTWIIAGEQ